MDPKRYTIEYKGRFTTIRTCGGPVGAFRGLTREKGVSWKYIDSRLTLVNGHKVICLDEVLLPLRESIC